MDGRNGWENLGLFFMALSIQVFYYFIGYYRARAAAMMQEASQESDPTRFVVLINKIIGLQLFFGIHIFYAMRPESPFRPLNRRADNEPIDYPACYAFWHTYIFPGMQKSYLKAQDRLYRDVLLMVMSVILLAAFALETSLVMAVRITAGAACLIMLLVNTYGIYRKAERMVANYDLLMDIDEKFAIMVGYTPAPGESS